MLLFLLGEHFPFWKATGQDGGKKWARLISQLSGPSWVALDMETIGGREKNSLGFPNALLALHVRTGGTNERPN